ncbi:hypothetical protein EGW08_022824 [Elysia chlorotica]|uniref:Uncharacterized protein n=1 Tax=Elysia chlorotica TaxID=188477 RepID=A0A433SJY7_ELYCH|nr:hypothetical protein EGW08_022824 [Elysia chlorotica]
MKMKLAFCCLLLMALAYHASGHISSREKRFIGSIKKAVSKAGKTVAKGAGKAAGAVAKGAGKAADAVDKGVNKVTDVVDKGVGKATGVVDKGIGIAVAAVVKGVVQAAGTVDKGIDKAIDAVEDGVQDTAKFTVKVPKSIGKGVNGISKKAYRKTYRMAQKSFNKIEGLAGKVDFDGAVDALIGMINSETSYILCEFACVKSAAYVMGALGEVNGKMACPLLCKASLAKLEDLAE